MGIIEEKVTLHLNSNGGMLLIFKEFDIWGTSNKGYILNIHGKGNFKGDNEIIMFKDVYSAFLMGQELHLS